MGKLLAVDPSMTATGWCLAHAKPSGVETWKHGTFRPADLGDLARWFARVLTEEKPDLVVVEEPIQAIMLYGKKGLMTHPSGGGFVTPNAAQTVLWKIEGLLVAICALADITVLMASPSTWRAVVLGDGKLPGAVAKTRARQTCVHLGIAIRSVDEAEACCIAVYGLGTIEFRHAVGNVIHGRVGKDGSEN